MAGELRLPAADRVVLERVARSSVEPHRRVVQVWRARNIKPWKVETFKMSTDPDFEAKLVAAIDHWSEHWNDDPKPFVWHRTAEEIIAKVRRGRAALDQGHHIRDALLVYPLGVLLRNATPSVFHQRHIGRVLRSSCNPRGRRLASSRGREPQPGRCPSLWPGDLRNDGISVAAAGADGSET
jgi:hypothetical protein